MNQLLADGNFNKREIKKKEINEKKQYRSVAFGGSALYFCLIEINEKREQYRFVASYFCMIEMSLVN